MLYVYYYLCMLLTYGQQICTRGSSDMNAPTDRFTPGVTYFSRLRVKMYKSYFGPTTVAQIVTAAHRDL